jgi:phosphate transport system permease protein
MSKFDPFLNQRIAKAILWFLALLTLGILFLIIGCILVNGLPVIFKNPRFLISNPEQMGKSGGILAPVLGTVVLTFMAVVVATPISLLTAIFLNEYRRETTFTKLVRFGTECLSGIPSIIFGLFGFAFFVVFLRLGWSILSGSLTLSFMILPTIIRTTEEALKTVPRNYREVAFAAGATRWQTITKVVLPTALPGIITGIILGIGRCVGETAATIFTAGMALRMPTSLFSSSRTLAVHFYIIAREGISLENAFASAAVLVILILVINLTANWLMRRFIAREIGN